MFKRYLLAKINPDAPFRLLLLVGFLCLVSIGSGFEIYDDLVVQSDVAAAGPVFLRMLIHLIPAYGLLNLKRWARILELVVAVAMIVDGLVLIFMTDYLLDGVFIVAIHGLITAYLCSKECRQAFGLIPKI